GRRATLLLRSGRLRRAVLPVLKLPPGGPGVLSQNSPRLFRSFDMRMKPVGMLLLVVAGVVGDATGRTCADDAPPNFVLVMCDDLGWGDVGFNGNEVIRTPHLDAMAAAGMKFNRFYAASAVCSPTRGSVLTGRHPERYGITGANKGHMLPRELTLAELLKQHGYTTGHFGK